MLEGGDPRARVGHDASTATPTSWRSTCGHLRRQIDLPVRPAGPPDRAWFRLPARPRWRLGGRCAASDRPASGPGPRSRPAPGRRVHDHLRLRLPHAAAPDARSRGRRLGRRARPRTSPSRPTQGVLPDLSPAPGRSDSFIQVVDGAGQVTEASANLMGSRRWPRSPGSRTAGSPSGPSGRRSAASTGDFRVAALSAGTPEGPVMVYVGRTLENVDHDICVAGVLLGVGLPAPRGPGGNHHLVPRSGGPSSRWSRIRAEVADITGSDLHRRVPQPADPGRDRPAWPRR